MAADTTPTGREVKAALFFGLLLCGCGAQAEGRAADPFSATGEMIAYSGGAAGPTNACFTCHGLMGEGDDAGTPRLAGLPAGYLVKQLRDYADGRRRHKEMHWIASRLSREDHLEVARWYASLPMSVEPSSATLPSGAALYLQGDPGRRLPPCAACHGTAGEGRGGANPPLAGQPPAYLADQIRRWRSGERQNDPSGAMLKISGALSQAEIEAVSGYAASLSPHAPAEAPERASSPPARRPGSRSDA